MKNFWFIGLILWFCHASCTKLNFPRVLLPIFDKVSVNFTLEVLERGCFKWTSSRSDLIQVTPLFDEGNEECSYKAIVTKVSKEKRRNTALVLAEDLSSGDILRCDVILDMIDELRVLTTTRELYLEEAPETFELLALDSQGNAFTTLEGVEFNWQISSQHYRNVDNKNGKKDSWHQVLRFLTFSESKYHEVPKSVEKLEFRGLKGYMVLLEGINTGTAKVIVRLPYPEYTHIRTEDVDIMVLANIILDPIDVHILVGDNVQFRVLQLKSGKLEEISLNNQYYLEVENSDISSIDGNVATGKELGQTSVILRDRNIPNDIAYYDKDTVKPPAPRATLTVSAAVKISISLLPHYNWITVEGERHDIAIDLFTVDEQKITLGNKYHVESTFDTNLFYVLSTTPNGSRNHGEAVKSGSTPVTGSFEHLTANADMLIYKKLNLTPIKVILPYDPNSPKRQKIQFKATGGDGSFTWSSLNNNLVQIAQNGLAESKMDNLKSLTTDFTETNVAKLAQIKVALSRNNKISKTADIFFLPPVKLEIIRYNFETALKDYVRVHVALYTFYNSTYLPFTSCENLNFELEFSNQIFHLDVLKTEEENLAPAACKLFTLKSASLGTTTLRVSYKFLNKLLSDEVDLVVFEKLNILNPTLNEVVLPIGASRNVIYYNGPQRLYNFEAELNKKFNYEKSIVSITDVSTDYSKDKHVFNILCNKIGETEFKFEIFNSLSAKNFQPYIFQYITKVFCVKPRFINLFSRERLRESCPFKDKTSVIQVKGVKDYIEIDIEVLDAHHRRLSNISSLVLEWEFLQGNKEHYDIKHELQTEVEIIEGVSVPSRDLLKASIPDIYSDFKIKSKVTEYNLKVLKMNSIKPEIPHFGIQKVSSGPLVTPVIENELNFLAVNSTLLPYDTISIYLSKPIPERIQIAQGSGYYDLKMSEDGIINVEFDDLKKEIIITPRRIGQVKIDLIDKCLLTDASHLFVSVVSIGRIEVKVPDRVEKTKSIEAIVKLYDSNNKILSIDHNNLRIYELHEEIFNSNILSVQLGNQNHLNVGEIRYIVTGLDLGESKIIFNSGRNEHLVSSAPATIQVFPPLRLYPRNVTLVIGASVQIYSKGGPYPDVDIVYSVQNGDVISIESAMAYALKLGDTKVTGRCIGVNPSTGNQIIFSEDSIHIYVIPFNRIKIKTPLVRIKSGAIMPAAVWGVPDLSPMIIGTLEPLKVFWSTNQPDVVEISGVFDKAGIKYTERDAISVRIHAGAPGKAQIHVKVITPQGAHLTADVEVTVFRMLELESPKRISLDSIMIPPNSNIQLKANLDDTTYEVDQEQHTFVTVSSNGLIKSGEAVGLSLVIASSLDQTLSIPIEVKSVHYLLATLHTSTNPKLKVKESKIPQGLKLKLKITLHDNLGNEFSHNLNSNDNLRYKLSKNEMVGVHIGGNFSIDVSLPRETSNMLSVSLKDTAGIKYAEDYIKLSVGHSSKIFPSKTIFSVGDIICFESLLSSAAEWTSGDENAISIDRETGVAVVNDFPKHGEKVQIYHGDKDFSFLKYDIEVKDADRIEFFKSYDIFNGASYKGHLVIKNNLQNDKFSNLISQNISTCIGQFVYNPINLFTCKLHSNSDDKLLENFKSNAILDKQQGMYACEIVLLTKINQIANIVKNNDVSIKLEARLRNGISDSVTLKLVPAITVFPLSVSVEQIPSQGITITGLDKILQNVEIKSSDSSTLQIVPQTKSHGTAQYQLKLIGPVPTDDSLMVIINSPLTQQNIKIPIQTTDLIRKCANQPFYNVPNAFLSIISNLGVIISSIIILAVTIWAIVFCSQRNSSDLNPQVFQRRSNKNGDQFDISNMSHMSATMPGSDHTLPSPYRYNTSNEAANISSGLLNPSPNESPVYGNTYMISPQKRINRRYL